MAHKINDQVIVNLVGSVEQKIPEFLENNLKKKLLTLNTRKEKKSKRAYLLIPIPALSAFLILLFFLLPRGNNQNIEIQKEISEIRTEFFIKEKNIKIIWFSKKNFNLRRKK